MKEEHATLQVARRECIRLISSTWLVAALVSTLEHSRLHTCLGVGEGGRSTRENG